MATKYKWKPNLADVDNSTKTCHLALIHKYLFSIMSVSDSLPIRNVNKSELGYFKIKMSYLDPILSMYWFTGAF